MPLQTESVVKSVDRVLDLFEYLGQWNREVSHADLAAQLGIPKSSLTLLLRNLVARGYVEFQHSNRSYRLGRAFERLATRPRADDDLISCAMATLGSVTKSVCESSAIYLLKGLQAEIVATVQSPQRLASRMRLGDLAPLYATAGGKAILAHLPPTMRDEFVRKVPLEPFTPSTICSADALEKELDSVRRTGLAFSLEEFTPGIVGIAAPLLDSFSRPLGSIDVTIPTARSTARVLKRTADTLKHAAGEILNRHSLAPAVSRACQVGMP